MKRHYTIRSVMGDEGAVEQTNYDTGNYTSSDDLAKRIKEFHEDMISIFGHRLNLITKVRDLKWHTQ